MLAVAGRHHGLVRVDLLRPLGVDRSAISRLAAAGVLVPMTGPGILRVAGVEVTPHQRLLAAVWAAGPRAAASHRAAAWLWHLDPIGSPTLDVTVPHSAGRRPPGVELHYSSALHSGLVTRVDEIPVTEPTLTLLALGSVVGPDVLERAFDSALRQGLTTPRRAAAILRRLGRRGRNGTAALRALLDARAFVDGVTESDFEMMLVQVLRRGGLPEPVRQFELHDADGLIGRFDCAYPEGMVVIEADSVQYHHDRERFERDRERRVRAEAIGWSAPAFTWRQVTRRPLWVARSVEAMLDASCWDWRRAVA